MEGTWNVGSTTTSFHITRIKHFSIWVIDTMVVGKLMLQCVQWHGHKSRHYLPLVGELSIDH